MKQVGVPSVPSGGIVGVFGLGGVGRLAVQLAAAFGLRVFGFDTSPTALEDAKKAGAEDTVDSSNADAMKQLVDKVTNNEGLQGAIVASGAGTAYEAAIRLTGF